MKEINILYQETAILTDENGDVITKDMLNSLKYGNFVISYIFMNDSAQTYLDVLDTWSQRDLMSHKLLAAYYFKRLFPESVVRFSNTDNYYNIKTNINGLATLDEDFKLSDYAFMGFDKSINIMFDYSCSGAWNSEGHEVILDMIPASKETLALIEQFAKGLNSMRIPYEDNLTPVQEKLIESYVHAGLKGAIALKNELPEWKITFHNYGHFFDLPVDENNESEILLGMTFEDIIASKYLPKVKLFSL